MSRVAVIVGASGLVGGNVLRMLLESAEWTRVVALVRKPLPLEHAKLEQRVCDFDKLSEVNNAFTGARDLFLCLGTTRKKAGSPEAFRRVDLDYPLKAAQLAAQAGTENVFLVSSTGASAKSPSLYLRTKAELEQALAKLSFRAVHVFRPSFLKGERQEKRVLEKLALRMFAPIESLMRGPLARVRPVGAAQVARAMLTAAQARAATTSRPAIHESEALQSFRE